MRATGIREYGGPELLQEVDLPAETLAAGRVRLRATAAALKPTDTLARSGLYSTTGRPEEAVEVPGHGRRRSCDRGRPGRVDQRGRRRPG